jgi:hypothetical protein
MEEQGAFSLRQASIKPQGTHHFPECSGQISWAFLLIEVSWREGKSHILDSEQLVASPAERR